MALPQSVPMLPHPKANGGGQEEGLASLLKGYSQELGTGVGYPVQLWGLRPLSTRSHFFSQKINRQSKGRATTS
jgi:hypothetical protein